MFHSRFRSMWICQGQLSLSCNKDHSIWKEKKDAFISTWKTVFQGQCQETWANGKKTSDSLNMAGQQRKRDFSLQRKLRGPRLQKPGKCFQCEPETSFWCLSHMTPFVGCLLLCSHILSDCEGIWMLDCIVDLYVDTWDLEVSQSTSASVFCGKINSFFREH